VFAPGGAYHLTARGVDDGAIFYATFDCFAMLALLRQVTKRCEWTVLAWCFMHTHYHLVVLTAAEPAVSDAMHRVNGTYAREFNLRHTGVGTSSDSATRRRRSGMSVISPPLAAMCC
jgi:REP element-mobilizing transposase RayT